MTGISYTRGTLLLTRADTEHDHPQSLLLTFATEEI